MHMTEAAASSWDTRRADAFLWPRGRSPGRWYCTGFRSGLRALLQMWLCHSEDEEEEEDEEEAAKNFSTMDQRNPSTKMKDLPYHQ